MKKQHFFKWITDISVKKGKVFCTYVMIKNTWTEANAFFLFFYLHKHLVV